MNELQRYQDMIVDAWKFFRLYSQPDGSEEFWERATAAAQKMDEKHKSKFFRDLMVAVLSELKRIGEGNALS